MNTPDDSTQTSSESLQTTSASEDRELHRGGAFPGSSEKALADDINRVIDAFSTALQVVKPVK